MMQHAFPALQAVIFDRDGVLTSFDVATAASELRSLVPLSFGALITRWQQHGAEHGFPRSIAEESRFWDTFWHALGAEIPLSSAVLETLRRLDYTRFVLPFPDARPALDVARQAGLKIGVLSNFSLASLDASLAAAGLGDLVDATCAATVIGAAKPDPRAYAAMLDALGVPAAATLFFDDEPECVAGARAVGMRAFLVDRTTINPAQPDVVPDLSGIERFFRA